jgi:hypothetical protein
MMGRPFPESQRDSVPKPRVGPRHEGLPWERVPNGCQPQRGYGLAPLLHQTSIPHITFIPFDLMFAQ